MTQHDILEDRQEQRAEHKAFKSKPKPRFILRRDPKDGIMKTPEEIG